MVRVVVEVEVGGFACDWDWGVRIDFGYVEEKRYGKGYSYS